MVRSYPPTTLTPALPGPGYLSQENTPEDNQHQHSGPASASTSAGKPGLRRCFSDGFMRRKIERAIKPHNEKRPDGKPAPSAVIDLREAVLAGEAKSDAFSTHDSAMIIYRGERYRLKCNSHGHRATFQEWIAGQVYQKLIKRPGMGPNLCAGSPIQKFLPEKEGLVGLASKWVDGYCDWGSFLAPQKSDKKGDPPAMAFVPEERKETYRTLLRQHAAVRLELDKMEQNAKLTKNGKPLAFDTKTNHLKKIDLETAKELEKLSAKESERLHLEDRMLMLLPPKFTRGAIKSHYEGEAIGNWDLVNHKRDNSGPVIRDGELADFISVDFGLSGLNGPEGRTKAESGVSITVAARINEPMQRGASGEKVPVDAEGNVHLRDLYLPGQVIDTRATDFRQVSPTPGLLGFSPRIAVAAKVMKDVVHDYQEFGRKPDEMLEVAYRLSKAREHLFDVIDMAWQEALESGDPAMLEMIAKAECSPQSLFEDYTARWNAIVERAGGDLDDWAERHQDIADSTERDLEDVEAELTSRRQILKPDKVPTSEDDKKMA